MNAFLLTLALFLFWTVTGLAFVSLLNTQRNLLRNALLSPAVGASLTVLLVIWANRMGLPVKHAGPVVTLLLGLAAATILWRIRPVVPYSRLKLFLLVLLSSALLTGYPMFLYGLNWVSFSNDDMANYCLGGKLFLNHGFLDVPNWQIMLAGRDASLNYWYMEVFAGVRAGCEESLAWVASITGLTTHQIFMPTILALQLVLIAATAAMVLRDRRRRTVALLVASWTAISGLVALGTVYQLIAQVFGLSLLIGLVTLLLSPFRHESRSLWVRTSLLRAILGAGVCVVYPEVLPFAVLSFLLYHAILLVRRRELLRNVARGLGPSLAFTLVLGWIFLPAVINFLLLQTGAAMQKPGATLFPYYLMPSGFAYLWGFSYIGIPLDAVSLNVFVLVGMLLFVLSLAGALALAWQGEAAPIMAIIMAGLCLRLFLSHADFGMFKIAMFIQPFLIASAVLSWNALAGKWVLFCGPRTRIAISFGPLVLLAALGMRAETYYVARSTGSAGSGFVEIPNASDSGLISTLGALAQRPRRDVVLTDSSNITLAKIESFYFEGSTFCAPTFDYFGRFTDGRPTGLFRAFLHLIRPSLEREAVSAGEQHLASINHVQFDMRGVLPQANRFDILDHADEVGLRTFTLVASGPRQGIVNRRSARSERHLAEVRLVSSELVQNHLVFVSSKLGTAYFSGADRTFISLYQPENDLFFRTATMQAVGRDILFQILRPSPQIRLVLDYTASLNADGRNQIPPMSVIGNSRAFFGAEGRGSARLVSPPVEPQRVGSGTYVLVDMGRKGELFPDHRWGLMRWYGMDLPNDPRLIVGFGRDISAISEEEYQALRPPTYVAKFPDDLASLDLEYSGIYEDGWIGESSFAVLNQPEHSSVLELSLMVPSILGAASSSHINVLVDGIGVAQKSYVPGEVQLRVPMPPARGKHRVSLVFDRSVHLPDGDRRPVSAQLHFLGFRGELITATPQNTVR
jgi:hypothetical protein